MDVRLIGVILFLGLAGCSDPIEKIGDEVNSTYLNGAKFYQQRCDVCHGPDGKLGVSEAKDLSISTITDKQIEKIIKRGQGSMPPLGYAIESDSTLIELVEHIKSLRE
jgi:mono/diheme cytochrome c family protein